MSKSASKNLIALWKEACRQRDETIETLSRLILAHPVFRSMPVGAPGSEMRIQQEEAIKAEDDAIALIAKFKEE